MRVGVIGAGNIGGTLGRGWAAGGHEVVFGVRDPRAAGARALVVEMEGVVQVTDVAGAVDAAEVVVFAIPGRAMAETTARLGARLEDKVVVDATNQIGRPVMHSLEALRAAAPGASLYRAFNALGWENFARPSIDGVVVDLFYCGDAGPAQARVHRLIADLGLRPVYVGGPEQADLLDGLTRLYFALAMEQGLGRRVAFKLLGA